MTINKLIGYFFVKMQPKLMSKGILGVLFISIVIGTCLESAMQMGASTMQYVVPVMRKKIRFSNF